MAKTDHLLHGRVGNLIFYSVRGATRVRSLPLSSHNPQTSGQELTRRRLIVAVRFYQRLKTIRLREVWRDATRAARLNGYNLFLKLNIHVFNERTLVSPASLRMTVGILPPLARLRLVSQSGDEVTISWENSLDLEGCRSSDRLQVVALFEGRMYTPVWLEGIEAVRGDRVATFRLGRVPAGEVHLYCFFMSTDGGAYSPSDYLCVTPKAAA